MAQVKVRPAAQRSAYNRIKMFSRFCYTHTDTFHEANGLLYADRTPKLPLEAIAAATLGRSVEEKDVRPEAIEAGWSKANFIQPVPNCGGSFCP